MGQRLPTILGKAIDDTVQTLNQQTEEDRIVDLVSCIERMENLMDDLHQNVSQIPIT
jgi:uncharacterized protein Yka (UPF0111/DUF47 family)